MYWSNLEPRRISVDSFNDLIFKTKKGLMIKSYFEIITLKILSEKKKCNQDMPVQYILEKRPSNNCWKKEKLTALYNYALYNYTQHTFENAAVVKNKFN